MRGSLLALGGVVLLCAGCAGPPPPPRGPLDLGSPSLPSRDGGGQSAPTPMHGGGGRFGGGTGGGDAGGMGAPPGGF